MLKIAKIILCFALILNAYVHAVIVTDETVDSFSSVPLLVEKEVFSERAEKVHLLFFPATQPR